MPPHKDPVTALTGIDHPFIQAPMFGASTPAMAAAANEAGALGSLAVADLPADDCMAAIRATQQLTSKPFAVNLFLHIIPPVTDALKATYKTVKQFFEELATQHQLDVQLPDIDSLQVTDYHDQLEAIIAAGCTIVSFTFGNLDTASIQTLKSNNVLLIGTATSVEEAILLENSGIDLICVQGIEAGGHRGSFAGTTLPAIGGMSLLPQVYDQVKVPLIYAGGLYNAKTVLAAKTLGAQGFQIGSMLLGSTESALQEFEKERLAQVSESDVILTRSYSGRYARGIKNTFTEVVEAAGQILPYPYQNKLTQAFRKAARAHHKTDLVNIWTGQSTRAFSRQSTQEILTRLIQDVQDQLYTNTL